MATDVGNKDTMTTNIRISKYIGCTNCIWKFVERSNIIHLETHHYKSLPGRANLSGSWKTQMNVTSTEKWNLKSRPVKFTPLNVLYVKKSPLYINNIYHSWLSPKLIPGLNAKIEVIIFVHMTSIYYMPLDIWKLSSQHFFVFSTVVVPGFNS